MKTAVTDKRGRNWKTYLCRYTCPDGVYGFNIMAVSLEHAAAMLADLKETAALDGELDTTIPADDGDDPHEPKRD